MFGVARSGQGARPFDTCGVAGHASGKLPCPRNADDFVTKRIEGSVCLDVPHPDRVEPMMDHRQLVGGQEADTGTDAFNDDESLIEKYGIIW